MGAVLTSRGRVDSYIRKWTCYVKQCLGRQFSLCYCKAIVYLLLALKELLSSSETHLRVLFPLQINVVQEVIRLNYPDKKDADYMAWMVEKASVIFLLLVEIKLVASSHYLGSKVYHFIMTFFLVIRRIWDPVFFVVSIVK